MVDCAADLLPRAMYDVYEGYATEAKIPMIATVIISSMSVKPRWFAFKCLLLVPTVL
jgi:hypothetical protein